MEAVFVSSNDVTFSFNVSVRGDKPAISSSAAVLVTRLKRPSWSTLCVPHVHFDSSLLIIKNPSSKAIETAWRGIFHPVSFEDVVIDFPFRLTFNVSLSDVEDIGCYVYNQHGFLVYLVKSKARVLVLVSGRGCKD